MYCNECGKPISKQAKQCPHCGAPLSINSMPKDAVQFRCKSCNNVMQVSASTPVLHCPYCDSNELIIESDNVTIERIKNTTEIEKQRHATAIEHEKLVLEDKKNQRLHKSGSHNIIFALIFFLMFFAFALSIARPDFFDFSNLTGKKITCPLSDFDCEKEHYSNVVMYFEDAGFTNVVAKSVTPSGNSPNPKPGYVYRVMIDGESNFYTHDKFKADAKIVIYYYPEK